MSASTLVSSCTQQVPDEACYLLLLVFRGPYCSPRLVLICAPFPVLSHARTLFVGTWISPHLAFQGLHIKDPDR